MKKYCSECGKELLENDKFCLECGTKVIDEDKIEDIVQKENPDNLESKNIPLLKIQNKSNNQESKSNSETNKDLINPIKNSERISDKLENKILFNKKILYALGGIILLAFVLYMSLQESNEQNEAIKKLDVIELKIQDAIKNKNYDYALIMVEQLTYSVKLNYEDNQKIAQQYNDKRNSLSAIIMKLKEQGMNTGKSDKITTKLVPIKENEKTTIKQLTPIDNYNVKSFIEHFISDANVKNIDDMINCYAEEVDYFGKGKVDKYFIRKDKNEYFKKWDDVKYQLEENSLSISDLPDNSKLAVFNLGYSVYSTERNKRLKGVAQSSCKIQRGKSGLEIYDEKQRILSRDAN